LVPRTPRILSTVFSIKFLKKHLRTPPLQRRNKPVLRYIISPNLHSNLEALNQFEKEIETIAHDKLVCLRDIVGYGADPNPCVEKVMRNVDFSEQATMTGPLSTRPLTLIEALIKRLSGLAKN
jgi:hypothetical protein